LYRDPCFDYSSFKQLAPLMRRGLQQLTQGVKQALPQPTGVHVESEYLAYIQACVVHSL
jgi:hypothetical protein